MAKTDKVVSFKVPSLDNELLKKVNFNYLLTVIVLLNTLLLGGLLVKVNHLQQQLLGSAAPVAQQPGNQPAAQATTAPGQKVSVSVGSFPVQGNANAKVTIVEFADFRCPFCEQYFTNTLPQLLKDYVDTGKVKYYFRNYAFLGPASIVAANAAECANDQGKFWDFHNYLYKNQPSETDTSMYNTDTLTQTAVTLGMDGNAFRSCLDGKKFDSKVSQDLADGQKAGVNGTPSFFVNGMPLVGAVPYSNFKTLIDQELAK
jgi:protein-disulfide isomerase